MPPRYAYWTILVDDQPTAFRAGSQEDLLPTLNRLKHKHPEAKMMWWQNGKLWPSRLDAQEAMRARGELGRRGDSNQFGRSSFGDRGGGFRDRKRADAQSDKRDDSGKLEWKPKDESAPARVPKPRFEKPEWKPKGDSSFSRERKPRFEKPEWKPKGEGSFSRERKPRSEKPEWTPKREGSFARDSKPRFEKPEWKPKGEGSFSRERKPRFEKPEWKPKGTYTAKSDRPPVRRSAPREGGRSSGREGGRSESSKRGTLEWKPKGSGDGPAAAPKRKWVPKEEYKKSQGIEAKRDKNWRPGGAHKDPRQKYKDAKKAKWTRFKQTIRSRSGSKTRVKKKDDE